MSGEIKKLGDFWMDEEPYFRQMEIDGVYVISRPYFGDDRGSFQEMFRIPDIEARHKERIIIKQVQRSVSVTGVLRGIHAENQYKLITPKMGVYFQVFVDLRRGSSTFGRWIGIKVDLTKPTRLTTFLTVPGIGNGFCVIEGPLKYDYATTSVYDPAQAGRGVRFDDPDLAISWPVSDPSISDRDKQMRSLKEYMEKYI